MHAQGGCAVEIVDEFIIEADAHQHEMELIAQYGRREFGGLLVNKTDGGDGMSGLVHTAETKAKIGAAHVGEKNHNFGKSPSAETRAKIAEANIGKTQSAETRDRNRQSQLRRFSDPSAREKLRAAQIKRFAENPGARERQSEFSRERFADPAVRSAMSRLVTERYLDPEEREKNAVAMRMKGVSTGNKSGFKGVSFDAQREKWFASLTIKRKQKNLGRYATPEDAARAYDAACIAAFGVGNCYLNFPPAANDNIPPEQRRSAA